MKTKHIYRTIFVIISMIFVLSSCSKDEYRSNQTIPYHRIKFKIDLNYDTELNGATGFKTFTEPRSIHQDILSPAGILVVRGAFNPMPLYAYDLQCPNHRDVNKVETTDGINAHCPVCGGKYDITGGFGTASKDNTSDKNLQVYRVVPLDASINTHMVVH